MLYSCYALRAIGEDSRVAEMIFCEVEVASRNGFDRLMSYIDVLQPHRPVLTALQHETKLLLWDKDDSYPFCHVSTTSRS